jgi:hypothetical protein
MTVDLTYKGALEAAGATVLAYETFGSYEGRWIALVNYNGQPGWVSDYYGSCSGCDAIEREFSEKTPTIEAFAEFGLGYLGKLLSDDEIIKLSSEHADYSIEDDAMLKWVKSKIGEK